MKIAVEHFGSGGSGYASGSRGYGGDGGFGGANRDEKSYETFSSAPATVAAKAELKDKILSKLDIKLQDMVDKFNANQKLGEGKADTKAEKIEVIIQIINPPDDALPLLQKIGIIDNSWIEQNSKLKCKVSIDKVKEIAMLDFASKIALLD